MDDGRDDEPDPASYAYWAEHGYQGRRPRRLGSSRGYLAVWLGLVVLAPRCRSSCG